jgi:hypothetical protein
VALNSSENMDRDLYFFVDPTCDHITPSIADCNHSTTSLPCSLPGLPLRCGGGQRPARRRAAASIPPPHTCSKFSCLVLAAFVLTKNPTKAWSHYGAPGCASKNLSARQQDRSDLHAPPSARVVAACRRRHWRLGRSARGVEAGGGVERLPRGPRLARARRRRLLSPAAATRPPCAPGGGRHPRGAGVPAGVVADGWWIHAGLDRGAWRVEWERDPHPVHVRGLQQIRSVSSTKSK